MGFYGFVGHGSIIVVELLALKTRLQVAWGLGIRALGCALDSKMTIELIHKGAGGFHQFAPIIHDIKNLLAREWVVTIHHTL